MVDLLKCMFDTNVFNRVVDNIISLEALDRCITVYATHIQRDELNNTKNTERRTKLSRLFSDLIVGLDATTSFVVGVSRVGEASVGGDREVPTESAIWDVSSWDEANWSSDDDLYAAIKTGLDRMNGGKPNNVQDALIAETSIKGRYVLVTDDSDLAIVAKQFGGKCLSVSELSLRCTG